MAYSNELDFEKDLIKLLSEKKGWNGFKGKYGAILKYPTEEDLIKNWAEILFQNNNTIDRLNDQRLTKTEMQQLIDQIQELRTPLKINGFINGRTVSIKRDNPNDTLHLGKEISLKIYDRNEIAAGQSCYQIAEQPIFKAKNAVLPDRRGDFVLLINGMPVIHVELKRSGVPISQATYQIEKYAHEGVFTGLFSLVQIFVAMTPEETLYFANPGPDGKFNKDFFFHWADPDNESVNDWKQIADKLLSIPMAHQLIGFYTVADDGDGILKVMRSYQYYAANAISDRVSKADWDGRDRLGGYIWHTTGSGKTMTSFKSAQLISNSKDADKVVFLVDRIELGTQSLNEYRNFADEREDVQETEDTIALIQKLRDNSPSSTLIVTSIQKMSNINTEDGGRHLDEIKKINKKRLVFIIDECHRDTFGEMLLTIKKTFPNAMFFGFTGTPIHDENAKKMNTTTTVFGNELHRYSIADGIRDKNVLGFDPYMVQTFSDKDLRKAATLEKAKAQTEEEAISDEQKSKIYYKYMDSKQVTMTEIEKFVPISQYKTEKHKLAVINDIKSNWGRLSRSNKFHAIFATSSIPEAIEYYRLFKKEFPTLKVTALFDPSIDNNGGATEKEDGLVELINDYNKTYGTPYSISSYPKMKKDISARLSHKRPYEFIEKEPEKQIQLLIVVDQMLTGFDSKWVNTLYLDKVLHYENIIQAFSRTNRLFDSDEKPFGIIRYYRYPNTMKKNIDDAIKLYSGDKPFGLFVDKLEENLKNMNEVFEDIKNLFENANIPDFSKLPTDNAEKGKFASLFREFNNYLSAAKIQGFEWEKSEYSFKQDNGQNSIIKMDFEETTYLILAMRYKELFSGNGGNGGGDETPPYDIDSNLIEIDTDRIDTDYMNSRFEKYLRVLSQKNVDPEEVQKTLDELHKSFAVLSQEEQKFANIFLHDVESGNVKMESGKTFRDYIVIYEQRSKNDNISKLVSAIGVDEKKLRELIAGVVNESNINEFGRFDELRATVDKEKAKLFFEKIEGCELRPKEIPPMVDHLLRSFIFQNGFDLDEHVSNYQFKEPPLLKAASPDVN